MIRFWMVASAVATLILTGCYTEERPERAEIEQQIRANEAEWNRAYAARDAQALARLYADDATLAAPGAPAVSGKAAIAREIAGFAADPNLRVEFAADRIQVARSGELAYSRGRYTFTMTDPATQQPQTSTGHYLTVWRKQPDDSWKAVEDFITPGPPQASE